MGGRVSGRGLFCILQATGHIQFMINMPMYRVSKAGQEAINYRAQRLELKEIDSIWSQYRFNMEVSSSLLQTQIPTMCS